MYMSDYIDQLDTVLSSGNRKLLQNSGTISHTQAIEKAKQPHKAGAAGKEKGVCLYGLRLYL